MGIMQGERGQSVVIGSLLMFAIAIALLGIIQTFAIPNQVAGEEQNHASQIDNEMAAVYAALTNAGGTEHSQAGASVTLGTDYSSRLFFITPPPATGSLRSQPEGAISVTVNDEPEDFEADTFDDAFLVDTCGLSTIDVHSLRYTAQYNEFQDTSIRTVETGVRYKSHSGTLTTSGQSLLRENNGINTINLMPITTGAVNAQGHTSESITFESGATGRLEVVEFSSNGAVEIDIPVHDPDAWVDIYAGGVGDVDVAKKNSDEVTLTLNAGKYRFLCTPVGLNDRPGNNPNPPRSEGAAGETGVINPIGENALVYLGTNGDGNWLFQNKDSSVKSVDAVRVPWVSDPGAFNDEIDLSFKGSETVEVTIGDDDWEYLEEDYDGVWVWNGGESEPVTVEYPSGITPNSEFSLVVRFEDGSTSTYFVNAPGSGGP